MIQIRKGTDRGHANHGWLNTYHSFSFAGYYDPKHVHFRSLRVLNEDRVTGGQGFGTHPHDNMEILSYVVSGALEHRDSMGHGAVMKAGDVQRISAGSGITHSEFNHSPIEPVHFLQIWLLPDERNVKPDYAERSFGSMTPGKLQLIASKPGTDGSIPIHQDVSVYLAKLGPGDSVQHEFQPGRYGWVQLIEGQLAAAGAELRPGDGAAISGEQSVELATPSVAHFLLFDLS